MGLDMYLSAKKYIGGWDHTKGTEKQVFGSILEMVGLDRGIVSSGSPSLYVEVSVAYWRKANQIHAWFVTNTQEGQDNCQESYVSREQLQELVDICKEVKADTSKAEELLPPQGGFFFGSTDIDEYYVQDLTYTIETLTKLLADVRLEDWSFYYHASW